MPRRNKQPKILRSLPQPTSEAHKNRYPTKQAAQAAVAEAKRYDPDLELSVYQSPSDSGWYLTSKRSR